MTTAQDGGKVVSLRRRPLLPPGNAPGTHFCYRLSRPQGHSAIGKILCEWKFPMTPAGIEPATFRFVTQHLNHCATAVPARYMYYNTNNDELMFSYSGLEQRQYTNMNFSTAVNIHLHKHFTEWTNKFTWINECNFYYSAITDVSAIHVAIFGVKRTRTQIQTTMKMDTWVA